MFEKRTVFAESEQSTISRLNINGRAPVRPTNRGLILLWAA
jgi:hypothetical protein